VQAAVSERDPFVRRVLAVQAIIGLICVALAWILRGPPAALSAALGFMLAVANTALVARDARRASGRAAAGAGQALAALYAGVAVRYALVVATFGIAAAIVKLPVGPAVVTFAVAQLAYGLGLKFRD
jgi:F0F1-type ATP synthase assembly protein I